MRYPVGLISGTLVILLCITCFVQAQMSTGQYLGGVTGQNPIGKTPTAAEVTNAVDKTAANTYSGTGLQDMSTVDLLQPVHSSDPGTCSVGQIEYNSTGAVMKFCSATNVWTQLGNAGSAGGGIVSYSGPSLTLTGTVYFPFSGGAVSSGTETNVDVEAPTAATITNFYVQLGAALTSGNAVFTWRKNATDTALTCTISGAATTCNDVTHSFTTTQGDLLDIKVVASGTSAAETVVIATQFGTTGSNGTVNSGTIHQLAFYNATGTAVSGEAAAGASGTYPKSNGTDWAVSTGSASGVGSCTNQVVTALTSDAAPTCTTLTSAYVNNTIALTGTDINTSNQITATHLASALPLAQGGLGTTAPFALNAQTTTYQVVAADFTSFKTIAVASGTFTITLVASGSQPAAGLYIKVVNYGTGVVTIARSGQNINGATTSIVLPPGTSITPTQAYIVSDGTNYFATVGFASPLTGAGDLLYGGTSGTPTRLATGTAKQLLTAGTTPAYIDFPDFHYFPAVNCVNTVAGVAWSTGATPTGSCRAGTNNLEGYLTWGASDTAQMHIGLPLDWDSATNPSVSLQIASTDATNGHTVIMQLATACAKGDGSVTDDVAFNTAQSFATVTLNGTASREWKTTLNTITMTGCTAGGMLRMKISRTTDTATNVQIYGLGITIPRLLTVQAN